MGKGPKVMKSLMELGEGECKFALTNGGPPDQGWAHLRLGDSGAGVRVKGRMIGGGAYPHQFCAEPVTADSCYCAKHHKKSYRGPGKDPRSLEEMIYATDQSQYRGNTPYAEHTDPMDVELSKSGVKAATAHGTELSLRRRTDFAERMP